MFLSTYENKIDKKGRVSVPASFRSYLSNLGYNGVICFPSFNNQSIEAWPQNRIEKISNSIDALNPFEEKKDFFATSILSESINLQFDSEGRISLTSKLLKHAKISGRAEAPQITGGRGQPLGPRPGTRPWGGCKSTFFWV